MPLALPVLGFVAETVRFPGRAKEFEFSRLRRHWQSQWHTIIYYTVFSCVNLWLKSIHTADTAVAPGGSLTSNP